MNSSYPDWIPNAFPRLSQDGYEVTSSPTEEYNCIAYAVHDDGRWWSHFPGYYWPGTRTPDVSSLLSVMESEGYESCDSPNLEEGFEKVAVFGKSGHWTHAARLKADGKWTSKLGTEEDIEHNTLESMEGDLYGLVIQILRKKTLLLPLHNYA